MHSLFEGMAIGLEESSSGVWTLMLAISIHAVPIVFCVGTDMISSGLKKVEYFLIVCVGRIDVRDSIWWFCKLLVFIGL